MQTRLRVVEALPPWALVAVAGALAVVAGCDWLPDSADFDDYARGIVAEAAPKWKGLRVPLTAEPRRPLQAPLDCKSVAVCVHGPAAAADWAQPVRRAAETALAHWFQRDWPVLPTDGGRGGSDALDVYLGSHRTEAIAESIAVGSIYDQAIVHARLQLPLPLAPGIEASASEHGMQLRRLARQVRELTYGTALLAMEPGEAVGWRRATARFLENDADAQTLRLAARGLPAEQVPFGTLDPDFGAGVLAFLEHRWGEGTVQSLWREARQITWEGEGVRGSPSLWEVLRHRAGGDARLGALFADFAVWLQSRGRAGSSAAFSGEPSRCWQANELPMRSKVARAGLAPFRSVVRQVCWGNKRPRVRLWLRGEYGVKWLLSVYFFDKSEEPLLRQRAELRSEPEVFLAVVPPKRAFSLKVVATSVPPELPEAHRPFLLTRSVQIVAALAGDHPVPAIPDAADQQAVRPL